MSIYNKLLPTDFRGNVEVVKQDQFSEVIDLSISILLSEIDIVIPVNIDDKVIRIDSPILPLTGHQLCLKQRSLTSFYQGIILAVTPIAGSIYDLTLDSPFDAPFGIDDGCSLRNKNLAVDGSSTPIIANLSPRGLSTNWDITRVVFFISDATDMDSGKFGGMPALTNGIVLRKMNEVFKNIFNAKTNGDFRLRNYDLFFDDKAPAGLYSVSSKRTFNGDDKNGVTIGLILKRKIVFK